MKNVLRAAWGLILAVLVGLSPANAATGIALLISNDTYDDQLGTLQSPANDVELIRKSLIETGFPADRIKVLKNVSRLDMLLAAEQFAFATRNLTKDDIVFFHYAGFGFRDENSTLRLVPVSAHDYPKMSFRNETISFSREIVQPLALADTPAAIVLSVDARQFHVKDQKPTMPVFGDVPKIKGQLISFSADSRQAAKDHLEGETVSPYAKALAKKLAEPGMTLTRAFGGVRPDVLEMTEYEQEPIFTSDLSDDLKLIKSDDPPEPEPSPTPKPNPTPDPTLPLKDKLKAELKDLGSDVLAAIDADDQGQSLLEIGKARRAANNDRYNTPIARIHVAACALGSAKACTDVGYLHGTGIAGFVRDRVKAAAFYEKGCNGSDGIGCRNLGYYYQYGRGGKVKDYSKSVELYLKACELGDMGGCTNAGYMYRYGYGVTKSHVVAVKYFRRACDGKRALGCNHLGNMYENGDGGLRQSNAEALKYYELAVSLAPDLNVAQRNLSRLKEGDLFLTDDSATAKDTVLKKLDDLGADVLEAVKVDDDGKSLHNLALKRVAASKDKNDKAPMRMFHGACVLGHAPGCTEVGTYHQFGKAGSLVNYYTATKYYRQGCEGNSAAACRYLGLIYRKGTGGMQRDNMKAVALFRKACDGGDAPGCTNLGFMHEKGYGGLEKNPVKAISLYEEACEKDDGAGCLSLGYLYRHSRDGLKQDNVKAFNLYKKACILNVAQGCTNLGYMYAKGYSVDINAEKAVEYYILGCEGGSAMGCNNLGHMYETGNGGLTADRDKAVSYYRKALSLDRYLSIARKNLKRLGEPY